MIIVFSGIHGSGKTTFAKYANKILGDSELVHIVDLSLVGIMERLFAGKQQRENINLEFQKDYGGNLFVFSRLILYWIDLLIFWIYNFTRKDKIMIYDRYFYDKIANFNLSNPFIRIYWDIYKLFLVKPDITFYIDVNPEEAYKRKPEYRKGFFRERQKQYLILKEHMENVVVLGKDMKKNKELIKNTLRTSF